MSPVQRTPLARAVAEAGPRPYERLAKALADVGLSHRWFADLLDGRRHAAGWIEQLVADALGRDRAQLFPRRVEDPTYRQGGRQQA